MSDPYAGIGAADPYAGIGVSAPRKAKRTVTQDVTGFMANVNRGLGIGDELAAAGQTGVNLLSGRLPVAQAGEGYMNALAAQRGYEGDYTAERPRAAAFARGTGSAATVAVPGAKAVQSTNMLANMGRGTVAAAGTGAAYAAADAGTARERVKAASDAALNPLNVVVGAVAGRAGTPKPGPKGKAPTLDQLKGQRKAAYAKVDASGERYTPEAFGQMVAGIKTDLSKARFDPDFHPTVDTMVRKLEAKVKQGYEPTLAEMDDLRKVVSENVASSVDKNVRRLGGHIMRGIDSFVDAQPGSDTLKTARDLHKRVSKIDAVQGAVDKAQRQAKKTGSGGNIDNATRQQLDKVLDKTANLTADERAALTEIVEGSKSANALRQAGKFSPSGNGLSQWFNLGAVVAGGPGALALPVGGAIAKSRAETLQRQKVQGLVDLIAVGGSKDQLAALQRRAQTVEGPAGSALRKLIAAKIAQAGGVTQASASPAR